MMRRPLLVALALLAGCHDPATQSPTRANFTAAVAGYLAQRGHLCVDKFDWPIVVTQADRQAQGLVAQQLALLESLGLATSRDVSVTHGGAPTPTHEYTLTAAGQPYYLHVPVVVRTPTTQVTHPADFCVARLTLDRVFGWEAPRTMDGRTVSSVLFSYQIADAAPWTNTPAFRRAFPMAVRAMANAGTLQLRLGIHLTPDGWIADELSQ